MNYRRLDPKEPIEWADEFWDDCHRWQIIDTPALVRTFVGRRVGGLIVRRQVELMNRDPSEAELRAVAYPYPVLGRSLLR